MTVADRRTRVNRGVFLFLATLVLTASAGPVVAQEMDCAVEVDYRSLQGNDFSFLDDFGESVREYINQRQWTDDRFRPEERIDCSFQVVFTEAVTLTRFRARLVLTTRRPIYGTVQQTTVLQISDENWQFDYSRGTPLIFEPDRYDAITSVVNFYVYLMLGYDYDTFDELGGTEFFDEARQIAERAQNAGASGWSSLGGTQSRGELISQIMDPRFRSLRQAYFAYHFDFLDHFVADTDDAQDSLMDVVGTVATLRQDVQRAYYLDQFFTTKHQEIASALQGSQHANQAFEALSESDPANMSTYRSMVQ